MSDSAKDDPPVKHCKVTVTKKEDGSYSAEYQPKTIKVTNCDTILNFKLVQPTPDDVIISAITVTPDDQDQLSDPSISKNGKQATLSDINTQRGTFSLNFVFGKKSGEQLAMPAQARLAAGPVYPEIDNDPP